MKDLYDGPLPGDRSILSTEHDELVKELYELRGRMKGISQDEKLILEAAIQLLEYQVEHVNDDVVSSPAGTKDSRYTLHWTVEDFYRFIACGGFELHHGRLVPRL